jgi:hypothetical protein
MATLKQRILWRAVPVGVVTAVAAYGLLCVYLSVVGSMTAGVTIKSDGPQFVSPLLFGLAGFAIAAGVEFFRREPRS